MADNNNSPVAPAPRATKPVSEALLNEKVCERLWSLSQVKP